MARHTPHHIVIRLRVIFIALVLCIPVLAQSDGRRDGELLRGFSASNARDQLSWERKMRSTPRPDLLREYMKHLSAEPHHVGSAYGKQNAEYILNKFRSWGWKAELEEFDVLFPTPKERLVEMTKPQKYRLQLKEPVIPEDPDSGDRGQLPTYNAYSADGDVTGPLVYANYGMPADYDELAKLGVDVKGKIVIARYGAGWRGLKPKLAYEHGAIGCLIYSDPRDDGYYQGDVYPKGPYRPDKGVQRGSVKDITPGDPLTPGWGSVKGARRLRREESEFILKIPVLPISYGDALPLLRALEGKVAPEPWRGALPITYHVGPGPAEVRLKVAFDWSQHTAYNVIARIDGSAYPDEWIIQGNHHDAWVNGADDPISGMVTVMEVGRAFGELLRQGWRPKRTIILCAWDAEEPGLLGSTEWAETHAEELKQKAVVYLNSDSTSKGWLGASGSHSLERLVNEVAREIVDPKRKKSVLDTLRERRLEQARTEEDKKELRDRSDIRIGALGSGSDYTAFLDFLGIASLNTGFGGEGGGGIYHSIYDSFTWYTTFSDTDFEYGRALAQLNGTIIMRLAGADVLPFDFLGLADTLKTYLEEIEKLARAGPPPAPVSFEPLRSAMTLVGERARRFDDTLRKASEDGKLYEQTQRLKTLNELLYKSERLLTDEQGLPRRSWFKHLIYAPGSHTGYAVKTIPGVREAIEQKKWSELDEQMKKVVVSLNNLAARIDAAANVIAGQ